MALSKLTFSKLWTSKTDFPTYEPNETQNREDLQLLFDELKTALNNSVTELLAVTAAAQIGFNQTSGVPVSTVQAAIENVQAQVAQTQIGQLANGTVTNSILADAAVTAIKIATAAVETAKIADAAVTAAKLATSAVETAKIADKAVTDAKLGGLAQWYGKRAFCLASFSSTAYPETGSRSVSGVPALTVKYDPASCISSNGYRVPSGVTAVKVTVQAEAYKGNSGKDSAVLYLRKNGENTERLVSNYTNDSPRRVIYTRVISVSPGDVISLFVDLYADSAYAEFSPESVEFEVIG